MPKDPWRHYATKTRLIEKGYFAKHQDRSSDREAAQAGNRHRNECSKEVETQLIYRPPEYPGGVRNIPIQHQEKMNFILNEAWVVDLVPTKKKTIKMPKVPPAILDDTAIVDVISTKKKKKTVKFPKKKKTETL